MALYETSYVSLNDGWSGRVVTRVDGKIAGAAAVDVLPTSAQWKDLLNRFLEDHSAMPGYEVLKYSRAGEVVRVEFTWPGGSIEAVCKRARPAGFWKRVIPALARRRARASFERGFAAMRAGVPTCLPLALLERTTAGGESWLVTRYVPGVVDLDHVLATHLNKLPGQSRRKVKRALTVALVELFDNMSRHGLHHRDMKASNIMVSNWNGAGGESRLWVLDLEGLSRPKHTIPGRRWRPLIRLAASLLYHKSVTRADYARFLRAYIKRVGFPEDSWKRYYRAIGSRAARYVQRARSRKTEKLDAHVE